VVAGGARHPGRPIARTVPTTEGLTAQEVAERLARGQVNDVPAVPSRTVGQIVRANVFTRFNALLGSLFVVTLIVGPIQDALFGFVLVANASIGIYQELRAKRTLDSLAVLTSPHARIVRDGQVGEMPLTEVVLDDVLELQPGDQVVVDGEVLEAAALEVDESLLTGEAEPVIKSPGDEVLSGSFVAAGSGRFRATRVGALAYAAQLAEQGRRFSLTRSELRSGIDKILRIVTWLLIPTAALLFVSQFRSNSSVRGALLGAVAGTVAMVPEGLVLLTSVAFGVGVVRLAKRRVLVQELPAVEVLARVDVLCIDKTGTLTEGRLVVDEVELLGEDGVHRDALAALAAAEPHPNATLLAIREGFPDAPDGWLASSPVPFSSARKWSGADFGTRGTWVLGAPDVLLGSPDDDRHLAKARAHAEAGRRVVLLGRTEAPIGTEVERRRLRDTGDVGARRARRAPRLTGRRPPPREGACARRGGTARDPARPHRGPDRDRSSTGSARPRRLRDPDRPGSRDGVDHARVLRPAGRRRQGHQRRPPRHRLRGRAARRPSGRRCAVRREGAPRGRRGARRRARGARDLRARDPPTCSRRTRSSGA